MDISNSPAIAITFRCNCSQPLHARTIGFLADWISAYVFIKSNKERLVLYFLVSFLGTFLIIFLVLTIRLYVQKRRAIRLLKETAPLVSPISDISYEAQRDTTLDPLDISVPTSHTTLAHGGNNGHHHQHHHPNHNTQRLPLTLTSVGGGHTQTHLDSQYQPLLTSPRHHHLHHHRLSRQSSSPQASHSVSQSPQQSPQRSLQQDSSQLNSSSSPAPNTSNNSSSVNNSKIIVNNISNDNSPININNNNNTNANLIVASIDERPLYATVPPLSQRRSTRESSSPRTIRLTPPRDNSNGIRVNNNPGQQQPNEIILAHS